MSVFYISTSSLSPNGKHAKLENDNTPQHYDFSISLRKTISIEMCRKDLRVKIELKKKMIKQVLEFNCLICDLNLFYLILEIVHVYSEIVKLISEIVI